MRKRYIAFVFGLVALFTYMALDTISPSKKTVPQANLEPDFIIKGLQAEYFSTEGQLDQQIDAEAARHLPETNQTLFEKPSVIFRKGEEAEWGMRAEQGLLKTDDLLTLSGSVQIAPLSEDKPAYTLSTDSLEIDLNKEIAETADLVLIEGPGTHLQAVGMQLLLKEEQANFLSEVRGRHDPKQNSLNQ